MEASKMTNELLEVVATSGVETRTATVLKEKFLPFFEQAEEWKSKAEALVVTDISQTAEMKMARVARLALKEIRVSADKTRKELKEDSLRYGKAVQGVYNVIEYLITPIEKHLQEQEDFVVIQEAKRRAELKANREMELQPFAEFVPMGLDLGSMDDADYEKTLTGAKLQLQAKIEIEQKAEADRIAKEKAEAEERDRQKAENEKLKAKLKAEQDAKAKLEAELQAKRDAEIKAETERMRIELEAQVEADKNAKAPIKKQLSIWVDSFSIGKINVENEKKTLIEEKFEKFKKWAKNEIESI